MSLNTVRKLAMIEAFSRLIRIVSKAIREALLDLVNFVRI